MVSHSGKERSDPRREADSFCHVEFKPAWANHIYQCRIWNLSAKGMGILVRENSEILDHLKIDDVLEMRYHSEGATQLLKTKIQHITMQDKGRFKGHFLVGLLVLGN